MISKELIKLKEQTDKLMKSEIMQKRFQQDRALMEQMRKSGLTAQMEKLHKQIVAVAPEMFRDIIVEQPPATPEPEPEPKTDKEIFLEKKESLQMLIRDYRGIHFDFPSQWECADEMRYRKDEGEYDTYNDAFRFAVKHYTADGKAIPSIKRLEKAYKYAKDSCYPLKSQPADYWDK